EWGDEYEEYGWRPAHSLRRAPVNFHTRSAKSVILPPKPPVLDGVVQTADLDRRAARQHDRKAKSGRV
ncbi:MAG TPA: hypothetical protein VK821_10395, partial [Dehalococcoidia bacterium]|nr:hypothetical protein [Dehalococcoidia bacterium]